MKRSLGLLTLALLLLSFFGVYLAIRVQEMTHLNWVIPIAILIWSLLLGFWYLIFGSAPARTRLLRIGGLAAGFLVLGLLGAALLRYDGSASGSSFPRLRWVWEAEGENRINGLDQVIRGDLSATSPAVMEAAGESLDFLGPDRDGMDPGLPYDPDWDANPPELLWKRPMGKAWSGFAVKDGRAITQEQAGNAERVVCLNLFTGEKLWHHDDPGIRLLEVKEENSGSRMGGDGPRSTPVISGNRIFALGSTGILNCLDLATGEEIWEVDTLKRQGGEVQKWGMANAPLLLEAEGLVVVPGPDKPGVSLAAYSKEDGSTRWTWKGEGASYSSPRILTLQGVRQIVSINAQSVSGHMPASGELFWKADWPGTFPKVAQPIAVSGEDVLVTASYGVGSLLLRVERRNGSWSVEQLWKSNRLKTKFSSPVVLDGFAYGIDEGRLASIDLGTGDKVWKSRKVGFGQQLLFADHLLVQTENGPVLTGRVTPKGFTETGRLEALSGMTWNVPTLAGRILITRNDREAACFLLSAP